MKRKNGIHTLFFAGCLSGLLCASLSVRTDSVFAAPRDGTAGGGGENSGSSSSDTLADSDYPLPYIPERAKPEGLPQGDGGDDGVDVGTDDESSSSSSSSSSAPPPKVDPKPKECPYFSGALHKEGENIGDGVSKKGIVIDDNIENTKCMREFLDDLKDYAKGEDGRWKDDMYAAAVAYMIFGGVFDDAPKTPKTFSNGAVCKKFDKRHHELRGKDKGYVCREGTWHFGLTESGACEFVSADVVQQTCGLDVYRGVTVNYIESSPISLIWKRGTDIDAKAQIARFALEPGSRREYCAWRGSAETPLLVYDPEHRGEIRGADQLFGEWTFGGKRSASLVGGAAPRAWSNGYEALATLDRNGDGKLSGAELDSLALWFDENQDAISQPGEVKAAHDTGVTAVYVRPDRNEKIAGHVFATRGFERIENGVSVTGGSVDWYAATAETPGELTANMFFSAPGEPVEAPKAEQPLTPAKASPETGPVSGLWQWTFEAAGDLTGKTGYLVLSQREGELVGYTMVSRYFQPSANHNLNSQVSAFLLTGRVDGGRISFESEHNGYRMANEATLSSDGNTLNGKSMVYYVEKGRNKTLSYNWKAERKG